MKEFIKQQFRKYVLPRKIVLLMDMSLVLISLLPAYLLRFSLTINQVDSSQILFQQAFILLPVYLTTFLVSGSYRGILRHSGMEDISRFAVAIGSAAASIITISVLLHLLDFPKRWIIPYSIIFTHTAICSVLLVGFRLVIRNLYYTYGISHAEFRSVLIFGAGELGKITLKVLENDIFSRITVAGFIDDNHKMIGKMLMGKMIYSEKQVFHRLLKSEKISEIILAINPENITQARKKQLLDQCLKYKVGVSEVPPLKDWSNGQFKPEQIRKIKVEDLLGRDPIWLDQQSVAEGLNNSVVLVTGAAGSIGSEIVRQLLAFKSKEVILVDQAESALYDLQNELKTNFPDACFTPIITSVTNEYRMRSIFQRYRPQYVFNAAAYKHVPLMEANPTEAIRVNIGGTCVIANLSVEFGVEKFVMISTDKAVNPTNVMGASKRICEIYIQALTQSAVAGKTQFITTRFGNVLGSNGSVVPLFRKQIDAGGPVTVTHPDIIRYFMTIPEACQLVLEAGFMGRGGEIYVFDMGDPVNIYDLALNMIKLAGLKPDIDIPITFTGLRPGEKLYEELLADEENTLPTYHPKIMTAKVRQYSFDFVRLQINALLESVYRESDQELVARMKTLVPEFNSKNSLYEESNPKEELIIKDFKLATEI